MNSRSRNANRDPGRRMRPCQRRKTATLAAMMAQTAASPGWLARRTAASVGRTEYSHRRAESCSWESRATTAAAPKLPRATPAATSAGRRRRPARPAGDEEEEEEEKAEAKGRTGERWRGRSSVGHARVEEGTRESEKQEREEK